MQTKLFEIRDRGTFIPVLCTNLESENEEQRYLLARAGYGKTKEQQQWYVVMYDIDGGDNMRAECDPMSWDNRTKLEAHTFIRANWDSLKDGDVIDVEYILGKTKTKKISERFSDVALKTAAA